MAYDEPKIPFDEEKTSDLTTESIESLDNIQSTDSVALRSKFFRWGVWRVGDCTMHWGTLTLFEDGRFQWQADISSTDSNDRWEDFYFEFESSSSALLDRKGPYDRLMNGDLCKSDRPCRWSINTGADISLAKNFNEIQQARLRGKC